ncbi:MAG TPA: polymer-forming cytoskeletal protein [Vicinamibacteria bacterium]|nr:polymer-forming cytoskeletal protein [Vicinamibacteria bacterium]
MANDQETILAAKATLDGKLEGIDITLRGKFHGDVKASGTVRIVEGSVVDAKVEASRVEISGKFHGEVNSRELRLLGPARASGTFRAVKLGVEEGSLIDGEFEIGESALKAASESSPIEQRR